MLYIPSSSSAACGDRDATAWQTVLARLLASTLAIQLFIVVGGVTKPLPADVGLTHTVAVLRRRLRRCSHYVLLALLVRDTATPPAPRIVTGPIPSQPTLSRANQVTTGYEHLIARISITARH